MTVRGSASYNTGLLACGTQGIHYCSFLETSYILSFFAVKLK